MRKIILFPCLLITLSAICQIDPTLKNVKKTPQRHKNTNVLSQQQAPMAMTKKKVKAYKKITVSKPTDHLLDLKNEPE